MAQAYRPADQIIRRVGWPCLWYRSSYVPSERLDGSQRYAVADSDNRGYKFQDPVAIQVLFTGHALDENFEMMGAFEQGRCSGTIQVAYKVKHHDRIVPRVFALTDEFTVVRGSSSVDLLADRWLAEVFVLRSASAAYTQETDFVVSVDPVTGQPSIEWLQGGLSPSPGSKYVVIASFYPIWIIKNHPMLRSINGKKQLPWRVELARDDVSVRGGA